MLILLVAIMAMAGIAFNRHREKAPAASAASLPKPEKRSVPAVPSVRPTAGEPKHYRPATMPESVRRDADAVAARHRGMGKEQLAQSAEMQQLAVQFSRHLDSPEFQSKLEQAVDAVKAVKGIEHGTLSFDLHDLSSPGARAWLEAALSDDPQPAQDYVMNLLDGAVFEFALDPSAHSSSRGVTVEGARPPGGSGGPKNPD